ncbi:MAG: chorismate mutase [Alphaproteobacteria bacterium]|nr:chorismate mutase [Alphaproteobacteria bacterium]
MPHDIADAIPPAACGDMATLRAQIDRLDRELVAMIATRLGYIARAAEIKPSRDRVHDSARIEDVVAKVRQAAERQGVPPHLVDRVWRELIAQSIAYEFEKFDARMRAAG